MTFKLASSSRRNVVNMGGRRRSLIVCHSLIPELSYENREVFSSRFFDTSQFRLVLQSLALFP